MNKKVGIIIVSYNATEAVLMTLESLANTKNDIPFSVALIDNASAPEARSRISENIEQHFAQNRLTGCFFPLDANLGFSGGNNVGIAYFLAQQDITHICLLNSDVVVCDHWLDYLLEDNYDAVGPLTNASNNEQGIPVPYAISRDNGQLHFDNENYQTFAANRREKWRGFVSQSNFISFFCVVFSRRLIQQVGYLDTRFYPGAYEDDDYCIRIAAKGFTMHIKRDVFLHHWGSASFKLLEMPKRSSAATQNRKRFINKYQHPWNDRTHLSWLAWFQDVQYALASENPSSFAADLNQYNKQLIAFAASLDNRHSYLSNSLSITEKTPKVTLEEITRNAQTAVNEYIAQANPVKRLQDSIAKLAKQIENIICQKVQEINAMQLAHAPEENLSLSLTQDNLTSSIISEEIFTLLSNIKEGIVFFAGYPFPERLNDGYFQRVLAIDNQTPSSFYRIYCDVSPTHSGKNAVQLLSENTILLQVNPNNIAHQLLVYNFVQKCKRVYYHSVLRTQHQIQSIWIHEPNIYKILDVHGVVPEEFIYCSGDYLSSSIYSNLESQLLDKCDTVVVVSEAMGEFLSAKHHADIANKLIIVPIFPTLPSWSGSKELQQMPLPKIVYAGGTHPWQCIPKMLKAIECIIDKAIVELFITNPNTVDPILPACLRDHKHFSLKTTSHSDLCSLYPQYHYGFLLREDVNVNRAACPTKLIEYLTYGIVPILDSQYIGDFDSLGMKYIHVSEIEDGKFLSPEEFEIAIKHNFEILETLKKHSKDNLEKLKSILMGHVAHIRLE